MAIERKDQNANNTGYPVTVYGTAVDGGKYGGAAGTGSGQVYEKVYEWVVDASDHAGAMDSDFTSTIPAGSTIISADVQVLETLSGGTQLDVGLVQPDGTGADNDALIAAFTETAPGEYAEGAGVAVDNPVAADSQLITSGRTAGIFRVRVKFLPAEA